MKNHRIIYVLSAAALLSVSCSKENSSIEPQNPEVAKTVRISISGEFSDFASTKGSVESIFRMKWANGDKVYVYGQHDGGSDISLLSETPLTATVVDDSDSRVADLAGTITAPSSGTKLTLVYSPLFSSAPSVSSNAITQSLAAQEGGAGDVTFIAYATLDYGGATTSTYRTSFKFATSVLRVNVSGMDKSQALTSATIAGIETACKLTISASAEPSVEGVYAKNGENKITGITRSFTSVSTNANGNIAFYVALPVITPNADRSLSIAETESHTYLYPKFVTKAVETGGNMLNTIAAIPTPIKYTENSVDLGYGTFIPETGVVWSPVNCGYEPTNYIYGKLYQWGRKNGCGYNDGNTYKETLIQNSDKSQTTLETEDAAKFYSSYYDWCSTTYYNHWDSSISAKRTTSGHVPTKTDRDPCPAGWRVPTYAELKALLGSPNKGSRTIKTGTHGSSTVSGLYYDGTAAADPSSGIFLPAAGSRSYDYGYSGSRLFRGYYWCSSDYDYIRGWNLYFMSDYAYMQGSYRANGYSVRCVQE